jgi:membrane-bound lytic murein transglycosylase MltF
VAGLDSGWKRSLGMGGSRYVAFVEPVFEEYERAGYSMDLFLFLALIRQESNFNPRDVSSVGAVGLTQIMPKTAKELGMQNVYMPPYFEKAGSLMERERKLRHRAKSFILKIDDQNKLELAGHARELMQQSITCRRERTKLFSQYKQEILKMGTDDRLDPHKAIKYGYKYFARMMTKQKGDISLALASYNAGPHRVKQYNGIPPYAETVNFRNKVLKYYREYLERIKKYRESNVE